MTLTGDANPEIFDSIFRNNYSYGIHSAENSAPVIRNCTIDGIQVDGSAAPIIEYSTISKGVAFYTCDSARPTFRNCEILGTRAYAFGTSMPSLYNNSIRCEIDFSTTGNVVAQSNTFYNVTETFFSAHPDAISSLVNGNSFNGITPLSGVNISSSGNATLNISAIWPSKGFIYNIRNLTISSGKTLTFSPGTVIKGTNIQSNGSLVATGSAQNPIRFENISLRGSLQMQYCSVTGSTIGIAPGSGSSITHCKILGNATGVSISDQVTMSDNVIGSNTTGISFSNLSGSRSIMNNTIVGNSIGIFSNNTGLTVANNVIAGNGTGISMQFVSSPSSTPSVNQNLIYGNATGLTTNLTQVLNAENNWWGAASGPSGAGPGTGDYVSTNVDFTPWLGSGTAVVPVFLGSVYVDPLKFSPGGGTATFYGQLTSSANWAIEIRNTSGSTVKTISGNGISIAIGWDGRSAGGSILSNGDYPFTVKAFNSDDSVADSVNGIVSLDSLSPIAVITNPLEGQVYKEGDMIEVDGTAKDSEFQLYSIYLYPGTTLAYSGYTPKMQSDIQRNNESLGSINSTNEIAGSNYSVDLVVDDTSGNRTVSHRTIKIFSLSAVRATPQVFSPNSDGDFKTSTITASLSMPANWQIEIKDSANQVRRSVNGTGSGVSFVWDGKDNQNVLVPSGQYLYTITGTDPGSGKTVGPKDGIITASDLGSLAAEIASPKNNDLVFGTVPIIGTASSPEMDKYVLEYQGPESGSGWKMMYSVNASHVNEVLGYWDVATFPEGSYSVRLSTYSKSGLTTSSSVLVNIRSGGVVTATPSIFNPSGGESITFTHTLPNNIPIELKIGNQDGNMIASIPCSGTTTVWNGRDDRGNVIKDGAYNFWLQGPSSLWNPSLFEGGESITYQVKGQLQTCDGFDPMADGICSISFTLPQPAIGVIGVGSSIPFGPAYRTLLSTKALPAGDHSIEWDGRDFAGDMVPSGEAVLAFTFLSMPNNIIMSTGSTPKIDIEGKSVRRFTPMSRYTNTLPGVEIKFNLPISAYLSVSVIDEENVSVRTLRSQILAQPGEISMSWDGFNDYGQLVDEGWYRVVIRTSTPSGDASTKYVAVKVVY